MNEKLKGKLILCITGSQGVAPEECTVEYGVDFKTLDELIEICSRFLSEVAEENYEEYLEECGYDHDEAMIECIADSGDFEIYLENDENPSFIYYSGSIVEI